MPQTSTTTSLLSGCRVQPGGRRLGFSSQFSHRDLNLEKEVTAISWGNFLLGNTFCFVGFFPC